jgi:hypothetical protein
MLAFINTVRSLSAKKGELLAQLVYLRPFILHGCFARSGVRDQLSIRILQLRYAYVIRTGLPQLVYLTLLLCEVRGSRPALDPRSSAKICLRSTYRSKGLHGGALVSIRVLQLRYAYVAGTSLRQLVYLTLLLCEVWGSRPASAGLSYMVASRGPGFETSSRSTFFG